MNGWNKGMRGLPPNRKPTGHNRVCTACAATFYVQPSRAGIERAQFCSRKCYARRRWSTGKCLECGNETLDRYCCNECKRVASNRRRQESYWRIKCELIDELGGGCKECGIRDIRVLELNHVDPSTKVRPADGAWTWTRRIKDWRTNAGNLTVLCANCHRLHTWEQQGFGIGLALRGDE